MTGCLTLRPARPDEYAFALAIYLDGMREHAAPLMAWDDSQQAARFAGQWRVEETEIILSHDSPAGFLISKEGDEEIVLKQFVIKRPARNTGLGSAVLDLLLDRSDRAGKPMVLGVLRGNPALRLYERKGFRVTGESGIKLLMRRAPGVFRGPP